MLIFVEVKSSIVYRKNLTSFLFYFYFLSIFHHSFILSPFLIHFNLNETKTITIFSPFLSVSLAQVPVSEFALTHLSISVFSSLFLFMVKRKATHQQTHTYNQWQKSSTVNIWSNMAYIFGEALQGRDGINVIFQCSNTINNNATFNQTIRFSWRTWFRQFRHWICCGNV